MSDAFYVGYQKQMPPAISSFLRARVILLLVAVFFVAFVIAKEQRPGGLLWAAANGR